MFGGEADLRLPPLTHRRESLIGNPLTASLTAANIAALLRTLKLSRLFN
jgi:hypothetical protein